VIDGENVKLVNKASAHVYPLSSGTDHESVLRVPVTTFVIPVLYAIPVMTFAWNMICENSPGANTG
jgi:hypothetical protein